MTLVDQHTQSKREALQSQFKLLNEKIKRLRDTHAIETDAATLFKLEKQIEQAEAERDAIERQFEALERQLPVLVSTRPHGASIPDILPYLTNRSDQEYELGLALQYLRKNKPRRPFICIIHGDERECQDMFLDRLWKDAFPRLIKLDTAIKRYMVSWPSSSGTRKNRLSRLIGNLAFEVLDDSAATIEEIVLVMSRHEVPVMIYTHLFTADWQQDGPNLMMDFIDFWNTGRI